MICKPINHAQNTKLEIWLWTYIYIYMYVYVNDIIYNKACQSKFRIPTPTCSSPLKSQPFGYWKSNMSDPQLWPINVTAVRCGKMFPPKSEVKTFLKKSLDPPPYPVAIFASTKIFKTQQKTRFRKLLEKGRKKATPFLCPVSRRPVALPSLCAASLASHSRALVPHAG